MRATKVASLNFGLVNVPMRMYLAVDDHGVKFHQHHAGDCLGGIGQVKMCKSCGEVVDFQSIVRGIDVDGKLVIVTPEELDSLEEEHGKQFEVLQFVDADEIDPILFETPYFLEPGEGGAQGYALLRQVMQESNRVAVVRYVATTKTHLAIVRVLGNVLILQTMRWNDQLRDAGQLKGLEPVELNPRAVKMAHMVVESMAGEFAPGEFVDGYVVRVRELIEAKAADESFVPVTKELDVADDVSDLLAQLEASIARHPAGKKRPAKAAKKAAPRKTAAKTPVRKTA